MTQSRLGITWSWDAALRGAICALPAVPVIVAVNVSAGICLALGTVLVAFVGVPPKMSMRIRAYLIAVLFAVAYALGSVVGQWPVVAVLALSALAYMSVLIAGQNPRSQLIAMLVVPGFAVGMNEPVPDGFVIAAMFLLGGLWATFVSIMWHPAPGGPDAPARFSALGDSSTTSDPSGSMRSALPWPSGSRSRSASPRTSSTQRGRLPPAHS